MNIINEELEQPLNVEERYLYAINQRLDVLIEMFSSFLDVYAEQLEIATTQNELVEEEYEEEEPSNMGYDELTKVELMNLLDHCDVEYNKSMLKAELVELAEDKI